MVASRALRLFSMERAPEIVSRDHGQRGRERSRASFGGNGRGALRLAALIATMLAGGTALANGPSLVVDADSGRVLHADRATDPWFPASITKLMTTYVALEMVRSGRASMDQLLTVSEEAYSQPPSKMAFKPGTQIRLDNALKIIMVKSANDIAATIAENLGGSVEGFSALMNDAAARLGMRESRFVNPHGLPDDRQQTSARDMAILARALLRNFPEQESLFQIGAIQFGRRIMRNHNGLIGRYPGADGMKTGFICASGFNVVASARRDGRRLITVVMGSTSANERTLKAAELFDLGFEKTSFFNPTLDALPASASMTPPNMRPVICDRRGPMPGEEDSGGLAAAAGDTSSGFFSAPNLTAFAPGAVPTNRTVLGPRGPVQPVRVWVGPNPPNETELTAQAEAEDAEERARIDKRSKKAKAKAIAARPAPETEADDKPAEKPVAEKPAPAKPAAKAAAAKPDADSKAMKAFIANEPKPIMDEGRGARATIAIKPVHGDDKPVKAKPAAAPAAGGKAVAAKAAPEVKASGAEAKSTDAKGTDTKSADPKDAASKAAPKAEPKADAKAKPALKAETAKAEAKPAAKAETTTPTPKAEAKPAKPEAKKDAAVTPKAVDDKKAPAKPKA